MASFEFEVFDRRWSVDTGTFTGAQWASVAVSCGEYAALTGVKPSRQVKLAAIALEVLRVEMPELRIGDLVTTPPVEQDAAAIEAFSALPLERQLALMAEVA